MNLQDSGNWNPVTWKGRRKIRRCCNLSRERKNNPMLVGWSPGVGKTVFAEGLSPIEIVQGDIPKI